MQETFEVGMHCYIIESNRYVTEVVLVAKRGDFYTVRFLTGGAISLRKSRIFTTREEAEQKLSTSITQRPLRSPYDYE